MYLHICPVLFGILCRGSDTWLNCTPWQLPAMPVCSWLQSSLLWELRCASLGMLQTYNGACCPKCEQVCSKIRINRIGVPKSIKTNFHVVFLTGKVRLSQFCRNGGVRDVGWGTVSRVEKSLMNSVVTHYNAQRKQKSCSQLRKI